MDNTNARETSQIIMSMQKATMFMDPFFKLTMAGTAFLITYLARMVKEGKVNKKEFGSVMEFVKATDGRYAIVNIPFDKNYDPWKVESHLQNGKEEFLVKNEVSGEVLCDTNGKAMVFKTQKQAEKALNKANKKEKLSLDELKQLGIRHVIMPDLNLKDGMVQVAVFADDKEIFDNWIIRYLGQRMQGGEKSLRDLNNLTNRKTTIISIPFEGEQETVLEDFQRLQINYSILPDLNVGDGEIQLVVANSDMAKVEFWYKSYAADQLKKGVEVTDMRAMDMSAYIKTGEMKEEQYVDTADEELKKANEKYEGKEPGEIEKSVMCQEQQVRSESDIAYQKYASDPEYIKLSIDKETCVEKSHFGGMEQAAEKGLFCSRVPGTWKDGTQNCIPELTLVVPAEQTFLVDQGRSYCVFVKKNEQIPLWNLEGNPSDIKMTGQELYAEYYDEVTRNFSRTEQLQKRPVQNPKQKTQEKLQQQAKKRRGKPDKNFNNFERRKYNMEDLEGELLKANQIKAPKPPVKAK